MSKTTRNFYLDLSQPKGDYASIGITLIYSLGGINYFYNKTNPRGYYLCFRPMTITHTDSGDIYSYLLFDDPNISFKIFIKEANRYNARLFEKYYDFVQNNLDKIRKLYETNYEALYLFIKSMADFK